MLRPKQINAVSQCARSFYLASSRFGTSDGAPCSSSEDEPHKRRSKTRNLLHNEKKLVLIADIGGNQSPVFKDIIRTTLHGSYEGHSHHAPIINPTSGKQSDGVVVVSTNNSNASKPIVKQLVEISIAKSEVFSNVENNEVSEEDTTSSVPTVRSSARKSSQRANKKNQSSSSSRRQRGSKYHATDSTGPNGRIEVSSDNKHEQTSSSAMSGNYVGSRGPRLNDHEESIAVTNTEIGINNVDKTQHHSRRKGTTSVNSNGGRPVEAFVTTLQERKWGATAIEALGKIKYKLDRYQANKVLKLLQDSSVALGFFNWLKCQSGFKHDEHTYTTMVGILGRDKQFGSINRLLEEMVRDGCRPNVVTYNRLIHGYGRANHIKESMEVFHCMQDEGCKPDQVTFCTLIDIHAKAGYLDDAMDLYKKMLEAGLCPDTFTYSVMINCLGKAGHLSAAYDLFYEMIDQGCVPNLVTYNIMIALQAKARNYTSALKLYRSMRAAGFRPDKITYSIVMEVLGHGGYLDEVEDVFSEMQQDCRPDEPAYGLLVDLWGKAGKVDRAWFWYQAMLHAGLRPNVPTCNSLLSAFVRADRFSDAYEMLANMLEIGLVPSLQTYTLLLSCCTERQSNVEWCCKLMTITDHPAHVFLSNMPSSEPGGKNVRDHASTFLQLMHSEDRESKRGIMDAVVDFLHKSGLYEEAGSVWEAAFQHNVYPDALTRKSSGSGADYWLIDLHVMSDGTAVIAVSRTLAWFRRQILEFWSQAQEDRHYNGMGKAEQGDWIFVG